MKWLLLIPGVILGLLLIALVKTLLTPAQKAAYVPRESEEESLGLARKLSRMVQVDTTSHSGVQEAEKFRNFHKTLEELFPLVFSRLEKTELDGNLLFYWKGARGDKPILLMSHQDVVPAEGTWEHAPFSGDIADAMFYEPVCKNCIRFSPVIYGPEQLKGMHGLNENIEYNCLPGAVRFYRNLILSRK